VRNWFVVTCRYECSLPVWSCAWNADDRNYFYAGLQNGTVLVFDIRNLSEPVITLNQDTGSRSPVVSVQYMPGTSGNSIRYSHCCGGYFFCPECESVTVMHTHHFSNHFAGTPALAGCPLGFNSPSFFSRASSWDGKTLFIPSLTQSHQVFLRRPLHLVPSVSISIHCVIQSPSSLHSICSNHLHLSHLVTKLTASNPCNFLTSVFFLFFQHKAIHPCYL